MKSSPEDLIKKYVAGNCNDDERALVESWHLYDLEKNSGVVPGHEKITASNQRTLEHIMQRTQQGQSYTVKRLYPYIATAAAILFILLGALLYLNTVTFKTQTQSHLKYVTDFNPGGNKAVLTLANGKTVQLNDAKTGVVINTAGLTYNDGTKLNDPSLKGGLPESDMAEIVTPKGGQYSVTLSDGSKVWLNSASAIRFPSKFAAKNRVVEIKGEAYFEVSKKKGNPFIVKSGEQTVEVLGTHFNINAYADESSIKTTLIEGSVSVAAGRNTMLLQPGQQSMFAKNKIRLNPDVDVEGTIAWKDGFFYFNGSDIETIMRQISRWYNVEVSFEGDIPKRTFSGKIYRNAKASEILDLLSYSNINFKTSGQKIIVLP